MDCLKTHPLIRAALVSQNAQAKTIENAFETNIFSKTPCCLKKIIIIIIKKSLETRFFSFSMDERNPVLEARHVGDGERWLSFKKL